MAGKARIAVIGAGLMGHGIAQVFALAGHDITITDAHKPTLDSALSRISTNLRDLGDDEKAVSRVKPVADLAACVRDADYVVEAILEDMPLKQKTFAEIEQHVRPNTILASNTSVMPITEIMQGLKHRERALGTHWWNPPFLVPLVEVIGTQWTSQAAIDFTMKLHADAGKQPAHVKKDVPGFIGNRLQHALWREAVFLAREGVASVADIDRAMTGALGIRWALMGPHTTFHLAGGAGGMEGFVKNLGPAVESWWADLGDATLDDETRRVLVDGMAETEGRDVEALARARNAALLRMLALDRSV